jgi:hypothetical protein|tara:strand:- start:12 stop:455 length:444 start_codon:yes stop_codon:yes gene_type:complete
MTNALLILGGVILAAAIIGYLYVQSAKKKLAAAKDEDQNRRQERIDNLPNIPLSDREDNAIYQWSFHHGERLVARVVKPEIDESDKRVKFLEITHSDLLLLPDECHYQKYKFEIDTVGDAIKTDTTDPEKGRILRDVTAHITGYVEQ